jgi:acetolactate synthase-1/2/3 large subunit
MRVFAELTPLLDRDAIVVIDAGDFGSYAGRVIDSYTPGAWLDSGPFGCLGSGPGYALAAKLARPYRQVVLIQGDGAFGLSGMEWDPLVRHGVQVVSVIGTNGMNALSKVMGFLILCIGIQFVVNGLLGVATDPEVLRGIREAVLPPKATP